MAKLLVGGNVFMIWKLYASKLKCMFSRKKPLSGMWTYAGMEVCRMRGLGWGLSAWWRGYVG